MKRQTLIDVMLEVGIAIELGGNPYNVLRVAKNKAQLGSSFRRELETLIKQPVSYLKQATEVFTYNGYNTKS